MKDHVTRQSLIDRNQEPHKHLPTTQTHIRISRHFLLQISIGAIGATRSTLAAPSFARAAAKVLKKQTREPEHEHLPVAAIAGGDTASSRVIDRVLDNLREDVRRPRDNQ
jgi:hypothetical protein